MAFDAYAVAVKITLANQVSNGLKIVREELQSTGFEVSRLNTKLEFLSKNTRDAWAALRSGRDIASVFRNPANDAARYQRELDKLHQTLARPFAPAVAPVFQHPGAGAGGGGAHIPPVIPTPTPGAPTPSGSPGMAGAYHSAMSGMMAGGLMVAGGMATAGVLRTPIDEAKKFQDETLRFASLGFGDTVNQQAVAYAQGMKTIGTSTTQNLTLVSDAMAVFKDLHHAEMAAPLMAKMKFANEAVFGSERGAANESKFMDMLKVVEFRGGLSSDTEFAKQSNFVQQVISGSRGRVDATQLLTALKTGGVALSRRSNEQFYLGSEPLIQEFGGSRYGTGAMSIYQNLVQARGTVTAQQELYRLGLLNPSMVEFNKAGRLKKALPGAFNGSAVLENEGELALLEKVLLPAFAAKGITGDEDIMRELGMVLGNRTGSSLMARIYQQRATLHNQIDANKNAMGIDQLSDAGSKTLSGKQLDLHAKWNNLMLALGENILPMAITAINALNPLLSAMTKFSKDHPVIIQGITIALIGLAGFLIAGGLVSIIRGAGSALTVFGPVLKAAMAIAIPALSLLAKGIMVVGRAFLLNPVGLVITAIAGAAYLLWNNWAEIKTNLFSMWAGIKTGFIQLFHGDIGGAFSSFKHVFLLGWQTIFNTLIAGANSILPSSLQLSKMTFADSPAAPVPGRDTHITPQVLHVNIDGKKLGEVMIGQMARQAARPQTAPQGFDLLRSPIMPGTSSTVVPRG